MRLAETHALRGYDALQLASALEVNAGLVGRSLPPLTFISADRELNNVASAEGLGVDDPNLHP
jgi:predicted nucleic acid-binding protein